MKFTDIKNISILVALVASLFMYNCNNTKREMIVKNKEVSIYTENFGNKANPAILLVAGATVSMLYWDAEFCQKLADKGFYVIRYDNRDVGKSTNYEPGTTPYTIVDLTDDAIAILDAYQINKAHLVGMSLGGLIAQIAALKYHDRVQSLTLLSTGPWGDSDPTIPEMDKRIVDFQAKSGDVNWNDENAVVAYMVEGSKLMSGSKPFDKQRTEQWVRAEYKRANNYKSMFNHAGIQGGEEFYNRLNEIDQPTLLIHGTDDQIWHFKHTKVMLKKIKGSKLLTLEGTGHELHQQDWDAIIEWISKRVSDL